MKKEIINSYLVTLTKEEAKAIVEDLDILYDKQNVNETSKQFISMMRDDPQ